MAKKVAEEVESEIDAESGGFSQEKDVNTAKIKLVILCHNNQAMDDTATYLKRRGWETTITNDLESLFKIISAVAPDFVMISVNVRSSKLQELQKVIQQAFNLPIITFGEVLDIKTMKLLNETPAKYSIQGRASGPSIHRKIKTIWQERQEESRSTKEVRTGSQEPVADASAPNILVMKGRAYEKPVQMQFSQDQDKKEHEAKEGEPAAKISVEMAEEETYKKITRHIFDRCAAVACEEAVEPGRKLTLVESCNAWPVKLVDKMGILMIAHSGDERKQKEFIHKFFKQLNKEIHERAKQISYEEEVLVPLEPVDLTAPIRGEVLTRKLRSETNEVIIKFIEGITFSSPIAGDELLHKDKAKINVEDLVPERTQGVNLYLYLPANTKYFLYLKSGAVLSEKQFGKLISTHTPVYVNIEDIKRYKEFEVRNKTAVLFANETNNKSPAA